jgi:MFS family permease
VILKPQESLNEADVEKGLKAVFNDGLASQAMVTMTGGVFLAAFALQLGAPNVIIGLLAAIPPLLQLVQLPSIFIVEKIQNRRAICVWTSILSRLPWLLVALSAFFLPPKWGLTVLIGSIVLFSGFGAISGCSWNSWMRDLVPQNRMGSFFSKRMQFSIGLGLILSLLAGFHLDWWKKLFPDYPVYGYSILFFIGFLAGIIGVFFISRIPEPKMKPSAANFFNSLLLPLKNRNFKRLIVFLGSWSFAVNLAAPFFTVYMLSTLDMKMSLVVVLSIISQVFNFLFLAVWGRFTDRFSNKSVLAVSCPLFIFTILLWTFTTMPEKHFLTFPLLIFIHILMGIAMAGVAIATGNIGLKLAPRGEATSFLAVNTIISSIAAGIAPIIGGTFADLFKYSTLSLEVNWQSLHHSFYFPTISFSHWDFFFVLAFLIGLYSLHRLSMVEEEGEVDDRVVKDEFFSMVKQPLRSLSTAAGIFEIVAFPVTVAQKAKETIVNTHKRIFRSRKKQNTNTTVSPAGTVLKGTDLDLLT